MSSINPTRLLPFLVNPITKQPYKLYDFQEKILSRMISMEKNEAMIVEIIIDLMTINGEQSAYYGDVLSVIMGYLVNDTDLQGGLLNAKMGLGKTLLMLCLVILSFLSKNTPMPTLVVLPNTTIGVWVEEIKRFFGEMELPFFVFHKIDELGELIDTVDVELLCQAKIVIVTYETVAKVYSDMSKHTPQESREYLNLDQPECVVPEHIKLSKTYTTSKNKPPISKIHGLALLFLLHWDRIILDESHKISNYKSLRSQAVHRLSGTKRWGLSGTPIRNKGSDLMNQLIFIGALPGDDDEKFNRQLLNMSAYDFHKSNLSNNIITVSYEDAKIKLPDVEIDKIHVTFSPFEEYFYRYCQNIARQTFRRFRGGERGFAEVLSQFMRLRQICVSSHIVSSLLEEKELAGLCEDMETGCVGITKWLYDDNNGCKSAKIQSTIQIIKERIPKEDKVIIFAWFKGSMKYLKKAIKNELDIDAIVINGDVRKERQNCLDRFMKDKNFRVLIISYGIGSDGLNLTIANHVILMERWWTPSVIDQSVARIVRILQEKECHVYDLGIAETVESRMDEICKGKKIIEGEYLGKYIDPDIDTDVDSDIEEEADYSNYSNSPVRLGKGQRPMVRAATDRIDATMIGRLLNI